MIYSDDISAKRCCHCNCSNEPAQAQVHASAAAGCSPFRFFKDFAVTSTLHGLKYIGEKRSFVERLFWTAVFLLSIGICTRQIYKVYDKWSLSPVIVSFSERSMPVFKVPFPAVTICPQMKTTEFYNYTRDFEKFVDEPNNLTLAEQRFITDVSSICYLDIPQIFNDDIDEIGDIEIIRNINQVTPGVDEIFSYCRWRGQFEDCSDIFFPVYTNEGVCFTFNSLAKDEIFTSSVQKNYSYINSTEKSRNWSVNGGYDIANMTQTKRSNTYPRIGRENSVTPDLELVLADEPLKTDPFCNRFYRGFKVFLHHPAEFPRSSLYYYAMIPKHETSLAVKFNMITTANSLKDYPPKVRQCYFPQDRQLKYFSVYTRVNCELECESNYTFAQCHCVWFNMPHDDSNNICRLNKLECVLDALERLTRNEMLASLEAEVQNYDRKACRCLPACNSTTYDAEVLKTEVNLDNYLEDEAFKKMFSFMFNTTYKEYSRLAVYFKDSHFPSIQRLELFGVTDFLAQCGGLLGVFLGFSFISLVEIIYFPIIRTLRWWQQLPVTSDNQTNKPKDTKIV